MSPSSMYQRSAKPSIFLQSMTRVVSSCELLGPTPLKIRNFLHLGCVFCLQPLRFRRVINTIPWKVACSLLSDNTHPCVRLPPFPRLSCTPMSHCTTILGHRREPLLLNVGQVSVLPPCRCDVLGKEVGCCLAHCIPFNHTRAIFSSTLILASGAFGDPGAHSSISW